MKGIFSFMGIIAISVALLSCSSTKKIIEPSQIEETVDSVGDDGLTEEQRMQFESIFFEALRQKTFGNTQNVVQRLSQCLEIDPNSSAAMYELANIHAANSDFTSASLLLEKAISIDDSNIWYKKLLGQVYQEAGKYTEAANIYTRLLQNDPDNQEYIYTKAVLLKLAKKYEEALQTYDILEKMVGVNEQISVEKQQLYVLNGQVDKAFKEIEKLIESSPSESKYYGLLADLYSGQGDRENAFKYYSKILEMDPGNGYVHFSLADYYLTDNNIEKAFSEMLEGFSSDEVDLQTKLQLYMMMASNRERSGLTNEREKTLVQVLLEQYPNEYIVYSVSADLLFRNNENEKGRDQLIRALELEKGDYMIWERLLFVDNDLQYWEPLYNHAKESIELFPNQLQGYLFNAIACIQLEKYVETKTVIDEGLDYIVEDNQLKSQFLMLKAEAEYNLNNLEGAFKLFDESIELDPVNYIALNNFAYYISITGGDLNKAERMSGKVIERFPDNSTYLDTHAWVLFKKGDYSLAKFYMEAAIENGGEENATLLEHYGDILFMLKNVDEAKKYWEKARDFGETSEVLERKIKENKYFEN